MIETSKQNFNTYTKVVYLLMLLWLISYPIRNNILTITISGFGIYANFIISSLLFVLLLKTYTSFVKEQKLFLLFLGCWLIYSVIILALNSFSSEGIFDIHSLFMQFIYAFIIFGAIQLFGWSMLKKLIRDGLRFFLVFLLLFGFFEHLTLYHIEGSNVFKLTQFPVASTFFAPFFIYDNNNDFCSYLIIVMSLLYLIDVALQKKNSIMLLLTFIVFFFAEYAQSRMAIYISYIYFIFFSALIFKPYIKKKYLTKINVFYFSSIILLFSLILSQNTFFNGKAYLDSPLSHVQSIIKYNDTTGKITKFKDLDELEKEKIIAIYSSGSLNENHSDNVRLNLLKNGIDMIKESPLLGGGPGSFRLNFKNGKFQYPTDTVSNPHNLVIELIAQFGIWGWGYFIFMLYFLYSAVRRKNLSFYLKGMIVVLILLYPFIGLIPSSFLYFNVHWLFMPLILSVVLFEREDAQGELN